MAISTTSYVYTLDRYSSRPSFLSQEEQEVLVSLLKAHNLDAFYERSSHLISSSYDADHLYVYLFITLLEQDVSVEELRNQACRRLFNSINQGFLRIPDPRVLAFLDEHALDESLREEVSSRHRVDYFDDYARLIPLENAITALNPELEEVVSEYVDGFNSLLKRDPQLSQAWEGISKYIAQSTTVKVNDKTVGCLLSRELQKRAGFDFTIPYVRLQID